MGDEARTIWAKISGEDLNRTQIWRRLKEYCATEKHGSDGRSGGPGSSEEDDYLSLRVELQFLASCPSENVQDGSWKWGLVLRGQSYKFWSQLFPDGVWSLRSLKVSQSVMLPRVWLIYNCWKSTWTTWSSSSTSAAHQLCDLAGGIYLLSLSFLAWKTESIIAISLSSWE